MAFQLRIDAPVLRPTKPPRTIISDARTWNLFSSTNCYVFPEIGLGMLLPLQLSTAWQQTGSGSFRKRLTDWTLPNAGFVEWPRSHADDWLIDGYSDGLSVSTASYPVNQAWWVSMFIYSGGTDARCALVMAYNGLIGVYPTPTGADISIGFYTDGTCKVWKGGTEIESGSIATKKDEKASGASGGQTQAQGATASSGGQYVDIMIIPQGRSLTILSSLGGMMVVGIPDLDDADTSPTLTAAGPMGWYAPALPDGSVQRFTGQICPMRFATTGTLKSIPQDTTGLSATPTYNRAVWSHTRVSDGVTATAGVVVAGDSTSVTVAMTGDGTVTPFVIGAVATWCTNGAYEVGTPIALNPQSASFDDGPRADDGKARFNTRLSGPLGTEAEWQLTQVGNRSWRLDVDCVCWMGGVCKKPPEAGVSYGNVETPWEADDLWGVLKDCRIKDQIPLDGLSLNAAVLMLLACAGIQSSVVDVPTIDYTLPVGDKGEWMVLTKAGESVGTMIEKLHDDYAKDHWFGFRPGVDIVGQDIPQYTFWWRDPEDLDTTERCVVSFKTLDGCETAVGFKQSITPPLTNELWVMGMEQAQRKRLNAYWRNTASQNINGTKTPEWLGQPEMFTLIETNLPTQTDVNRFCTILAKAWGKAKVMAEFQTIHPLTWTKTVTPEVGDPVDYKIPVWSGDLIRMIGFTGDLGVMARVRTVGLSPELVDSGELSTQKGRFAYTVEIVSVGV